MKGKISKILTAVLCVALLVAVLAICAAALPETPNIVVYVGGDNASDSHADNVIGNVDNPVATLEKAYELVCASAVGTDSDAEGVIVLKAAVGPNMSANNGNFNIPSSGKATYIHAGTVTLTSNYGGVDYRTSGAALTNTRTGSGIGDICYFQLGGPTVWEDLVYNNPAGTYGVCVYAGDSFTIKSTFTAQNVDSNNDLVICAGWCRVESNTTANIEILGGNIGTVTAATLAQNHQCITGTTNITIGGSANVRRVVAGPVQQKQSGCTMTTIANVNITVADSAVVSSYNAGGANRTVTNSTLILAGGTVTTYAESSNVTNRNLTLSNITGSAYTLPSGTWNKLTVTGNSNISMTAALPATTALVVESPAVVTLAEGDTHAKDGGNGTVNYVHSHNWVENVALRESANCTQTGKAYYECDITNCTETKDETLPLSHNIVNGVCSSCGGKGNVVYVADGGTGDGYTASTPVGTMEAAYDALFARTDIETDSAAGATIVVCGTVTVKDHFNYGHEYTHAGTITYDGMNYNAVLGVYASQKSDLTSHSDNYNGEHRYQFGGPTVLKNLTIDRGSATTASVNLTFYAGTDLVIEETVKVINTNWVGSYVQPVTGLTDQQIETIKLSAHRGYQPMGPENSILSYTAAGEQGFDYIECDVYQTTDGVLVTIHDNSLERTTNGTGNVTEMTYEEILQYRIDTAGYGFDINSADTDDLYVPTFREYLEICKQYGCKPFIEIKDYREDTVHKIIDVALEYFDAEDIVMSCISLSPLETSYAYNKDVFHHLIWGDTSDAGYANSISILSGMKNSAGQTYAGIAFNITNLHVAENYNKAKSWIERANEANLQTCLRGADDMTQVRLMYELGIDYYPTNTTNPEKLQQLKQGVEGGYSYASASGGRIFVRGGYRGTTTADDISITLLGGMYDFAAPSNGEGATTGSYSITVGGNAFVSRLVAGETATGATGDRTSSAVTVQGEAVVNDLYLAGDLANTKSVTVNLLGGTVKNMSERRDGKSGTAENVTVHIASVKELPESVGISNTSIITGSKTLVVGGTGVLNNSAAWDKLVAADGALIDLTGTYPQTLEKEGSGKFRIDDQSVTFGTVADIKEDKQSVVLGSDIPCTTVGSGTVTVTWYKDNEGAKGEALTAAPKAAGAYWVGVAVAEGTTDNEALVRAAVAEQLVSFTIVHDLTAANAQTPDCTEDGILAHYTCSGCDLIFADAEGKNVMTSAVDPAAGHKLTKQDGKAATCTEDGVLVHYTCSGCDSVFADAEGKEVLKSTVIAKGHSLSKVEGKAATATENGSKEHYACVSCGKLYADAEGKAETTKADIVINATGNSSDTGDKAMLVPAILLIVLSMTGMIVMLTGKKQWER